MVMVMKRQPLSPKWLIGFVTNSNVHLCPHCGDGPEEGQVPQMQLSQGGVLDSYTNPPKGAKGGNPAMLDFYGYSPQAAQAANG